MIAHPTHHIDRTLVGLFVASAIIAILAITGAFHIADLILH